MRITKHPLTKKLKNRKFNKVKININTIQFQSKRLSSEYEYNVSKILTEKTRKLSELQNSNKSSTYEKEFLKMEIETLESLYENYNMGLNYFRRAKGGRNGLRELRDKE
jgi:colicin import membrane protein